MNKIRPSLILHASLVISVFFVMAYLKFNNTRVYKIPLSESNIILTDDREQGGTSDSKVEFVNGKVNLRCNLKISDYPWPYCGVEIKLFDGVKGRDLSKYNFMTVGINYLTSDNKYLRVYLKNHNNAYSIQDDMTSLKVNGAQVKINDSSDLLLDLKDLNVMTWWISGNKIPPDLSTAEINNIHYITIATGDSANVGEHRISIDSVYFSGEYIKKNDFLLILLITNLTAITSFLFLDRRRIYFAQGKYLESIFLLEEERNNLNFKLIRDPLTHAFNRYAIESLLIKYSERGPLEMPRLSIIYLDIDHFKVINDTFGHHVGDSILIEVVNLIQDSIGCDDVLVRWGGEEFIVFSQIKSLKK